MNASKVNDTRFWTRWRNAGAVGSMPTAAAPKTAKAKAKAPKTVASPKAPKAKPAAKKRVKAATPPQTVARTFGTKDLGKDASPRWAVIDKATDKQVDTRGSRAKAQARAKELNAA